MSATEEVLEQIPPAVVEDAAGVVTVVRNNPYILAGCVVAGLVAGGVGGYKFAQSRLRGHYEDIARQEIEEAREYYTRMHAKPEPEELLRERHGGEEIVGEAAQAHRVYSGEAPAQTEEEVMSDEERALHEKNGVSVERVVVQEETRHSVFEGTSPVEEDNFDYAAEVALRTEEKPYVITHDEFFSGELDYEQTHVTYFQGDNVLVDERDQPIPDEDATVGSDNLTRFGHGSKDANIVYVRNDRIEVDFEITRSFGKYVVEVMGMKDDDERGLKHSAANGGVRKFRDRD